MVGIEGSAVLVRGLREFPFDETPLWTLNRPLRVPRWRRRKPGFRADELLSCPFRGDAKQSSPEILEIPGFRISTRPGMTHLHQSALQRAAIKLRRIVFPALLHLPCGSPAGSKAQCRSVRGNHMHVQMKTPPVRRRPR